MGKHTLGIDLGVRAAHVATLCDERGEVIWSKRRFRNASERTILGDADQGDDNTGSSGHCIVSARQRLPELTGIMRFCTASCRRIKVPVGFGQDWNGPQR